MMGRAFSGVLLGGWPCVGHGRFGQDLWKTGRIIRPDVYSCLTGDQPWINHEWLAEAVYAWLYSALGPPGLVALNIVVGLGIVGLIYGHLLRRGVAPAGAACIVAFFALPLRPGVLNVRPQVFTYLLFLSILLVIDAAERGALRWLWAVPLDPLVADFPARAVALMKASGVAGNMATEFNWGEYVLWHLGPQTGAGADSAGAGPRPASYRWESVISAVRCATSRRGLSCSFGWASLHLAHPSPRDIRFGAKRHLHYNTILLRKPKTNVRC